MWVHLFKYDILLEKEFHEYEVLVLEVGLFELQGILDSLLETRRLHYGDDLLDSSLRCLLDKFPSALLAGFQVGSEESHDA